MASAFKTLHHDRWKYLNVLCTWFDVDFTYLCAACESWKKHCRAAHIVVSVPQSDVSNVGQPG